MTPVTSFEKQFWSTLVDSYELQLKAKSHKTSSWVKSLVFQALLFALRVFGRRLFSVLKFKYSSLSYFLSKFSDLELLYTWLWDVRSRELLVDVLVRRMLGQTHLLPLVDEAEENLRFARSQSLILEKSTGLIKMGTDKFVLNFYDLADVGFPLRLNIHEMDVVWTFMSEQYRYQHGAVNLGVEHGDVIIDGGGCWGDTAMYFAFHEASKVYSFEFVKDNLKILRGNLAQNPSISPIVEVVERALWHEDDVELIFESAGPGTGVRVGGVSGETVKTITIDTYVAREGIERIDFIKLDIEGAELKALEGARNTIKRFVPRLAIAIYHKQEDLCTIPHYLKSLCPEYEFYLDHFTTSMIETVLFARQNQLMVNSC